MGSGSAYGFGLASHKMTSQSKLSQLDEDEIKRISEAKPGDIIAVRDPTQWVSADIASMSRHIITEPRAIPTTTETEEPDPKPIVKKTPSHALCFGCNAPLKRRGDCRKCGRPR